MKTLADAFEHTLKDIYFAENAIVKALLETSAATANKELKDALKHHAVETKGDIETLRAVFKSINKKPEGEKCDAIEGLIDECNGVITEAQGAIAKDAMIIGCCQAIEHYEIARFGTLRAWAKALGLDQANVLLTQINDDHKAADHKLSHLAILTINQSRK